MRQKRAEATRTRVGRGGVAPLVGAATAIVVASAILALTVPREPSSPNRRLAEAVGAHRVTRGRLTGGFAYAPCDTTAPNDSVVSGLICERSSPAQWVRAGRLAEVGTEIRQARVSGASAASRHHAFGTWHVVWGNPDAAIEELRAAAHADPTNARVQSDLAAAFLARAGRAQDPRSILDAHTAADSAIALDPTLPEARFNRAVALEWLHLRNDAVAAWSSYLELDRRSPWADEAREHRRILSVAPPDWRSAQRALWAAVAASNDSVPAAIARQFPMRMRKEAHLATLAWARAYRGADARPDTMVSPALTLARALAAATADSLWLDAVQAIIRSTERREKQRLDATAHGIIAYATGETYLDKFYPDSAAPWLTEAERALTIAQNPARFLATLGLARAAYGNRSFEEALATLRRVRSTAPRAYPVVRILAARTEGLIEGQREANFYAANAGYSTAIRESAGNGDVGLQIRPRVGLAGHLARLGLDEEGWKELYTALGVAETYAEASIEGGVPAFARAARMSAARAPRAALLFQQEAIRLASPTISSLRDSLEMISALRRQAELLGRAGRSDEAFESVRKARMYIERIEVDSITAFYTAETDLVDGAVWLGVNPDTALRVLRRAIDSYRHPRYRLELDRALLLFANAYAAVGAMDSAQRAFEAAIAETERRRSKITLPDDRARFLDQARPVIDRMLTFLVERGDTLRALEFLERMRGRVLLEHALGGTPNGAATTPSIETLRSTLPSGASVVSYAVLDKELVIWLIRRDGVFMYRRPGAGQLEELANRFAKLITARSPDSELSSVAAELHRLLIAPFEARLEPESRLIFVPDKWLHFVPFAALLDNATRKFVVERFETGIAPSLQLYVQSASRYQRLRDSKAPAVLAVGDPAFDAQKLSLPRLPGAEQEARRVAAHYEAPRLLVGDEATKGAFLDAVSASTVVHFAGHGVVRPEAPLLSHLVLAPDATGEMSGVLTARELFDIRLPSTRLAILSGCHTASGRLSATEGASSLARALFAAGVPAVVASLWAVDDEDTADFFVSYHQRLSRGEDPTSALARTQRDWIARGQGWQGASTWAAFALFGATRSEVRGR